MMKKIFILCNVLLMGFSSVWAQETANPQDLLLAQQQAQEATAQLKKKGHLAEDLLAVVAGGTAGGLAIFGVKKLISYAAIKEEARGYLGLYKAQADLARGGSYLAGELGTKNVHLLQKLLTNWKTGYVYEMPVIFTEPWGRKFFVIDQAHYKEFLEQAGKMWEKNLSEVVITEQTRMRTLRGLGDIRWDCVAKFNEDLAAAMSKNGPLSAYVKEFATLQEAEIFAAGRKNFTAGLLRYKGKGRPVGVKVLGKAMKKVVVFAALVALTQVPSSAEEQEVLARVDANPALLLQATEQDLSVIAQSPELSNRFLSACALVTQINELPNEDLEILGEDAQAYKQQQKRLMQQQINQDLRNISNR